LEKSEEANESEENNDFDGSEESDRNEKSDQNSAEEPNEEIKMASSKSVGHSMKGETESTTYNAHSPDNVPIVEEKKKKITLPGLTMVTNVKIVFHLTSHETFSAERWCAKKDSVYN